MERVRAGHTVTNTSENKTDTVAKSGSDAADYKWKPPSRSVVNLKSHMRREIHHPLPDFDDVTKCDFEAIVENRLTKWASTLHFQNVKAVYFPVGDT